MEVDLLIVGGGLTGCALALALRHSPLRVALVESQLPAAGVASFDERHLALSLASVEALRALGVWARVTDSQPLAAIHVSSQGDFGTLRLEAARHGLPAFGAVLPARVLGAALQATLAAHPRLQLLRPAELTALDRQDDALLASVRMPTGEQQVRARLVVGADGTESAVRRLAGIAVATHDYGQTALVSNVEAERAHDGLAFERMTRHGPLALLPLPGGRRCGVVWTQPGALAQQRLALADAEFLDQLQEAFGWRLGRLRRLGRRQPWPLRLARAEAVTGTRLALIGNAAQTVHPIGAQGFNLGLRDALALARTMGEASDPGTSALLAAYAASRAPDRARTIGFSDGLVHAFASAFVPARLLRSLGLLALDALPPLQAALVRFGTGFGRAGLAAPVPQEQAHA